MPPELAELATYLRGRVRELGEQPTALNETIYKWAVQKRRQPCPDKIAPIRRMHAPRRPRARSSSSASRDGPDDDLADLQRRCPRCGGALRALLPGPHWRCDRCADALWEAMVEHDLERVLDEAERITRWAS